MLCGGTIFGDPTTLLSLYTLINNFAFSLDFSPTSDQLFLIFYMYHFGESLFPNTNYLKNGNKIFMFKLFPYEMCDNCHLIHHKILV